VDDLTNIMHGDLINGYSSVLVAAACEHIIDPGVDGLKPGL